MNWLGTDWIKRLCREEPGGLGGQVEYEHGTLAAMKDNCIVQRCREVFFFFLFSTFGATGVLCLILCSAKGCMT